MSNYISKERIIELAALFSCGNGIRSAARISGVALNTSMSTYHRLLREGFDFKCMCGKPSAHNGWCHYRVSMSSKRQATIKKWSNGSAKQETIQRWAFAHQNFKDSFDLNGQRLEDKMAEIILERAKLLAGLKNKNKVSIKKVRSFKSHDAAKLYRLINPWIPPSYRDDVSQNIFMDLLEGVINIEGINQKLVSAYVKEYAAEHGNQYGMKMSLDDQWGDSGITVLERVSNMAYKGQI